MQTRRTWSSRRIPSLLWFLGAVAGAVGPAAYPQPGAPPGEPSIGGRVLGPDGTGVPDAQVLLMYTNREAGPKAEELRTSKTSATSG